MSTPVIDVLFPVWNRCRYAEFSLSMLLQNTDWSLVRKLIVHDDGSDKHEGTLELVREMLRDPPVETIIRARPWEERYGSPAAVTNWYISEHSAGAERFLKVDSDIIVPPGYLEALLSVVEKYPHTELLGMEAGRMGPPGHNGAPWDWERPLDGYSFEKGSHIGGVGLMKTESFRIRPRLIEGAGRQGFTQWQHEYEPVRGWITPDLLVSELSRIPFDPWRSLHDEYVSRDWEREWPPYHARWRYWWSWWDEKWRSEEEIPDGAV